MLIHQLDDMLQQPTGEIRPHPVEPQSTPSLDSLIGGRGLREGIYGPRVLISLGISYALVN